MAVRDGKNEQRIWRLAEDNRVGKTLQHNMSGVQEVGCEDMGMLLNGPEGDFQLFEKSLRCLLLCEPDTNEMPRKIRSSPTGVRQAAYSSSLSPRPICSIACFHGIGFDLPAVNSAMRS